MMSHFNPFGHANLPGDMTPCGKQVSRCNWTQVRSNVTCKDCLADMPPLSPAERWHLRRSAA
jgi:hypothetical protein